MQILNNPCNYDPYMSRNKGPTTDCRSAIPPTLIPIPRGPRPAPPLAGGRLFLLYAAVPSASCLRCCPLPPWAGRARPSRGLHPGPAVCSPAAWPRRLHWLRCSGGAPRRTRWLSACTRACRARGGSSTTASSQCWPPCERNRAVAGGSERMHIATPPPPFRPPSSTASHAIHCCSLRLPLIPSHSAWFPNFGLWALADYRLSFLHRWRIQPSNRDLSHWVVRTHTHTPHTHRLVM